MARCSCSGSTGCSCRLDAGGGIIISGSGAASDPFVISAEITSFAASFSVQDTDSVNLSLVGAGVPTDPFVLTANSSIAMTQLSDWDDPAGPAVGEVPVWNGIAWEAAAPPTVPPGAVNVGAGLLGDGSAPTPIRVAVSDLVSTSTSGTAIYVDSAGQLRAVPGGAVAWSSITGKPSTFPSTWDTVTGKPTTFAPQIGTTSTTAKAGNWYPTWAEVSGKPVVATVGTAASSTDQAVMRIATVGGNQLGMYWDTSTARVVTRVDATDQYMATVVDTNNAYNLSVAHTDAALGGKANAYGSIDATRYTYGPSSGTYSRNVAGSGFFAVWMDAGLEFGRNVSARKYKEAIEEYAVPVADVLALQPVKYVLKSSPEAGPQYGLIADDVALTLPEIVTFENDEPETIRYDLLAVALLDVVKDQQARLDSADRKHELVLARLRTLEGGQS